MKFTALQKKEAYKKLPLEVQDFIMSSETNELIEKLLKNLNLNEEEEILADLEILYAMYDLQSISDTINNISKITNRDISELLEFKEKLYQNIFREIEKIKEKVVENKTEELKPINNASNNIGQSFEEIVLHQAQAMQPARLENESEEVMEQELESMDQKNQTPENLPVENSQNSESRIKEIKKTQIETPNYSQGDPYREPLE